jgi:hypothetical protein
MDWKKFCTFTFLIILKYSYLIYEQPSTSDSLRLHNTMALTFIYDCKRIKIRHNLPLAPFTAFLFPSDRRAFNRSRPSACIDIRQDFDEALKKIKDKSKLSLKPFSTEATHVCCTCFVRRGLTSVKLSRGLPCGWPGNSFVCVI